MRRHLLAALVMTFVATPAAATPSSMAHVLFSHRARAGETLPMFEKNRAFESTGRLPVVVDFTRTPTAAELAMLEAGGVVWLLDRSMWSGAHLASVDEAALVLLE